MKARLVVASAVLLAAVAGALAQPRHAQDLVGQSADASQRALSSRGYTLAHSDTLHGRQWQYWWHARNDDCELLALHNGRVERVVTVAETDCVPQGGNRWRMSEQGLTAQAAARLLGVDALRHRSHERDMGRHRDARAVADFERGYRDAYDMRPPPQGASDNAYGDGYRAYAMRRPGHASQLPGGAATVPPPTASPASLVGSNAGGLEAAMTARGYKRWSTNTIGRETFSVWRSAPRQCLRTTVRDGVVTEVGETDESVCP